jgi:ankyrin repeat protein
VEVLDRYYTRDPASISLQDDINGNLPLHIAAQNGFTPHVALLLRHGADINARNGKGNTALHMAWSYDYMETAEHLVAAGADESLVNDAGFRAAMGIEGDKSRAVVYLLAAQTEDEVKGGEGGREGGSTIE